MPLGLSATIPDLDAADAVAAASDAADAGAELISYGEARYDPLALAAAAAGRTPIELATGIARWDRDPAAMARAAVTVAEVGSRGFRLGIGTGPIRSREQAAGALGRMRAYVRDLRAALNGRDDVALELAALRPGMARLAGAVADGVVFSRIHSIERLKRVILPAVEEGEDGRSHIRRTLLVRCAVAPTEPEGIDVIRRSVVDFELPLIAATFGDEGVDLTEAIDHRSAGRIEDAAAAVPEEAVRTMALVGPADACLEQLRRYEGLVDLVALFPCGTTPHGAIAGALDLLRLASGDS